MQLKSLLFVLAVAAGVTQAARCQSAECQQDDIAPPRQSDYDQYTKEWKGKINQERSATLTGIIAQGHRIAESEQQIKNLRAAADSLPQAHTLIPARQNLALIEILHRHARSAYDTSMEMMKLVEPMRTIRLKELKYDLDGKLLKIQSGIFNIHRTLTKYIERHSNSN